MRLREFVLHVGVSREFIIEQPDYARERAQALLHRFYGTYGRALRGPRGGRYIQVGEPFDFQEGQMDRDWMTNTISFTARVNARYVRPRH